MILVLRSRAYLEVEITEDIKTLNRKRIGQNELGSYALGLDYFNASGVVMRFCNPAIW